MHIKAIFMHITLEVRDAVSAKQIPQAERDCARTRIAKA